MMMNTIYLLLGANLGNKIKTFEKAIAEIEFSIGEILKKSSLYETEPWGFESDESFLNQTLEVETEMNAFQVLETILTIEEKLGRVRKSSNYESRSIDIDMLFFNKEIIETEHLKIPHPHLHERNFTLKPLAEITPEFIHPKLNQSIKYLMENSKDQSKVALIKV